PSAKAERTAPGCLDVVAALIRDPTGWERAAAPQVRRHRLRDVVAPGARRPGNAFITPTPARPSATPMPLDTTSARPEVRPGTEVCHSSRTAPNATRIKPRIGRAIRSRHAIAATTANAA